LNVTKIASIGVAKRVRVSLVPFSPIFLAAVLLNFLASVSAHTQVVQDSSLATILARAYSMLQVGSPDAERLFRKAESMDPSSELIRSQLGYLYHSQKRYDLALQEFRAADSLRPSDSTKLQIAYTLASLDRTDEAKGMFKELQSSPIPNLREQANVEIAAMAGSQVPLGGWWNRIYAVTYYDTRWNTTFYQGDFQHGYNITEDGMLSGYGYVSISGDARSSGGLAPEIFSDNAMIVGLGIRAKPLTGLQLSIQEGVAYDLIKRNYRARANGDFRAVVVYGNGIYAPFSLHDDFRAPLLPFADMYSSVGYYSRYQNTIGYLVLRGGLRLVEVSNTVSDVYGRLNFARDATFNLSADHGLIEPNDFYNNINEWGVGLRIAPNIHWGFYLVGEFLRGMYSNSDLLPSAREQYYDGFRFFLLFDRTF
jgi:tetratricopeptide (TPR) repeat protein